MREVTISRNDFRKSQDPPFESLFEWILRQLGVPEEKWDEIDDVTIKDIMVDSIETS